MSFKTVVRAMKQLVAAAPSDSVEKGTALPTPTKTRRAVAIRLMRANGGAAVGFITGLVLGVLSTIFFLRGVDWNGILVVITAIYVLLTYFLLRTSLRQAATSEQTIKLIRSQMATEERRKAGPIDVLALEVATLIHASEKALCEGMWGQAVLVLPENFGQIVAYSTTVDPFLHDRLTSVQKAVARLNDDLSVLRSNPTPEQCAERAASAKERLKFVKGELSFIRTSINRWDEEEGP